MEIPFNSGNIYQSILGAVSHPSRPEELLVKVASGLMNNGTLDPNELQKGVQKGVDTGLINVERANQLFPGVKVTEPS
jgi:hypothetical protein